MEARIVQHSTQTEDGKHGAETLSDKHQAVGQRQFIVAQDVHRKGVGTHVLQCSEDVVNEEEQTERAQVRCWVIDQQESGHGQQHTKLRNEHPRPPSAHGWETVSINHGAEHQFTDNPRQHTC